MQLARGKRGVHSQSAPPPRCLGGPGALQHSQLPRNVHGLCTSRTAHVAQQLERLQRARYRGRAGAGWQGVHGTTWRQGGHAEGYWSSMELRKAGRVRRGEGGQGIREEGQGNRFGRTEWRVQLQNRGKLQRREQAEEQARGDAARQQRGAGTGSKAKTAGTGNRSGKGRARGDDCGALGAPRGQPARAGVQKITARSLPPPLLRAAAMRACPEPLPPPPPLALPRRPYGRAPLLACACG